MKLLSLCCQLTILVVFTIQSNSVFAQIPSYDQWFKGEIILKNSLTYQGDLKYDFRDDILYFKKDTLNLIFHASHIKDFKIYRASGVCDQYTTLAYKDRRKMRYKIFQVVYPGSNSEVLAREIYILTTKYTNIPVTGRGPAKVNDDYEYYRDRSRIKTEFKYYIQSKNGTLTEVKLTRRKVLKAFPDNKDKIKDYMVENNLYFRKFGDLVKVVEYYDVISRR